MCSNTLPASAQLAFDTNQNTNSCLQLVDAAFCEALLLVTCLVARYYDDQRLAAQSETVMI